MKKFGILTAVLIISLVASYYGYAQYTVYKTQIAYEDGFFDSSTVKQQYDDNGNYFYDENSRPVFKTPISLALIAQKTGESVGVIVTGDMLKSDYDKNGATGDGVVEQAGAMTVEAHTYAGYSYTGIRTSETDTAKVLRPTGFNRVEWHTPNYGNVFAPTVTPVAAGSAALFDVTDGSRLKGSSLYFSDVGSTSNFYVKEGAKELRYEVLDSGNINCTSTGGLIWTYNLANDWVQFTKNVALNEGALLGDFTGTPAAGQIRWTGTDAQLYTGVAWVSLTVGGSGASPCTTKGDISSFSTAVARLPVGTDGKLLQANSAEATGLKWVNTAGSSPLTTKGDLWGYSTADARQAVGTDGYVLSSDSAEATGLKWIAAVGSAYSLGDMPGSGTAQLAGTPSGTILRVKRLLAGTDIDFTGSDANDIVINSTAASVSQLSDLSDVDLSTPIYGNVLIGNVTASKFSTGKLSTSFINEGTKLFYTGSRVGTYLSGTAVINDISNVNTGTLGSGDTGKVLKWAGSEWQALADSGGGGETGYDAVVDAAGGGDYTTIEAACAAEGDDNTIYIRNGTYTPIASFYVKNGQKLIGESRDGVVIEMAAGTTIKVYDASFATYAVGNANQCVESSNVGGNGTNWTSAYNGDYFILNAAIEVINNVNSSTLLTLVNYNNGGNSIIYTPPINYFIITSGAMENNVLKNLTISQPSVGATPSLEIKGALNMIMDNINFSDGANAEVSYSANMQAANLSARNKVFNPKHAFSFTAVHGSVLHFSKITNYNYAADYTNCHNIKITHDNINMGNDGITIGKLYNSTLNIGLMHSMDSSCLTISEGFGITIRAGELQCNTVSITLRSLADLTNITMYLGRVYGGVEVDIALFKDVGAFSGIVISGGDIGKLSSLGTAGPSWPFVIGSCMYDSNAGLTFTKNNGYEY